MEQDHKELQLLPTSQPSFSFSGTPSWPLDSPLKYRSPGPANGPPLDLQLSMSLSPKSSPSSPKPGTGTVEVLKWQAAEQIRLAAMEKTYAERVRELTKREIELAQSEFARARHVWERARVEVEKVERMKERASRRMTDSTCMEITCRSCRQKFLA